MPYYARIENGVCTGVLAPRQEITGDSSLVTIQSFDRTLIGRTYSGGQFGGAATPSDPAAWWIDVGPFFDRFGASKYAILASSNATVQALVKDLQVRRWVDLQRADVAAGIDMLISAGVPGVNGALKTAVLTTPVATEENMALRKLYL